MMKTIALALALNVAACGGMQHTDAALQAGVWGALWLDKRQTETIVYNCNDQFTETNPLIGNCNDGPLGVTEYFPLMMVAHLAITAALPKGTARTAWQALTLGVIAKTVHRNWNDGVRIVW